MLETVLLASKPCPECAAADEHAVQLADGKSILSVLHIRAVRPEEWTTLFKRGGDEYDEEVRGFLRRRFSRLCEGRAPWRLYFDEGTPSVEILRWAWKTKADCIVLGSPTSRTVEQDGLRIRPEGSAVERVASLARCPVYVAPATIAAATERKIAAAVDLGPDTERIAVYAAALAEARGARLELIHVVDPKTIPGDLDLDAVRADASRRLDSRCRAVDRKAAPVRRTVLCGDPVKTLLDHLDEAPPLALVMGRGETGRDPGASWSKTVMGRTAESAPCPVIALGMRATNPKLV